MIVDTSVIVAILADEEDADVLLATLLAAPSCSMSAAAYLEAGIAADNPRHRFDRAAVDKFIEDANVEIVPVDPASASRAADAHTRFGRWSRSKAKLNFGDCFSYALAMGRDDALLFKGDDFRHTDVKKAL